MDGSDEGGRTRFAPHKSSPGERGDEGGEPVTHIAFSRWMTRDEISHILGVSERTIQKRVRSQDIKRRDDPDRPRYCLLDTPWSRSRLGHNEGGRMGGEPGANGGANLGGELRPPQVEPNPHLQELLDTERIRALRLEQKLDATTHELLTLRDQHEAAILELEQLRQRQQTAWWRLFLLGWFGWFKRIAVGAEERLSKRD